MRFADHIAQCLQVGFSWHGPYYQALAVHARSKLSAQRT
jgi:hypothetical protein